MRTTVEKDGHLGIAPARHDDRLRADVTGDEVAGPPDLALVADEYPSSVEDLLQLVGEDPRIGVQRGVDAVVLNERLVADRPSRRHGHAFFLLFLEAAFPAYACRALSDCQPGWTWPQCRHVRSDTLASNASMAARRSRSMSMALMVSRCSSASQRSQNHSSDS